MVRALRHFYYAVFVVLLVPALVLAQEKKEPSSLGSGAKDNRSATGEAFRDLVGAWWLWLGIIVILGLLGVLYYMRNKRDDD